MPRHPALPTRATKSGEYPVRNGSIFLRLQTGEALPRLLTVRPSHHSSSIAHRSLPAGTRMIRQIRIPVYFRYQKSSTPAANFQYRCCGERSL